MDSGRLIIVCGLPGAGKTTLAKSLEAQLGAIRLSPDEWMDALDIDLWDEPNRTRIQALQWTLTQQLLKLGLRVIIEWGTWGRSERDTLRLGARDLAAAVELHYLEVSSDKLFERIRRRGMEDPPIERDSCNSGTTRSRHQRLKRCCSSTGRLIENSNVKKIPSEPYPELQMILVRFTAGVQNASKSEVLNLQT